MSDLITSTMPPAMCPTCAKKLNRASSDSTTDGPNPGDVTVCLHCGAILAFKDDMSLRVFTDEERETLDDATRMNLTRYQWAVQQVRKP